MRSSANFLEACEALEDNVTPVIRLTGTKAISLHDDDCVALAEALRRNTACLSLHLDINSITDEGLMALASVLSFPLESITQRRSVQKQSVSRSSNSGMGAGAATAAAAASGGGAPPPPTTAAAARSSNASLAPTESVQRHKRKSDTTTLEETLPTDKKMSMGASERPSLRMAFGCTQLKELRLGSNLITDAGAIFLLDHLPPSIRILDLSCNRLSNATVKHLVKRLREATELTDAAAATEKDGSDSAVIGERTNGNKRESTVGDGEVQGVRCGRLSHVELRDNPGINDDCWPTVLLPFLTHPTHCRTLETLYISGNPFTNAVVRDIATVLSQNTTLRALGIGNSVITDVQPIVDAVVNHNSAIYVLPLSYLSGHSGNVTRISNEALERKLNENRRRLVRVHIEGNMSPAANPDGKTSDGGRQGSEKCEEEQMEEIRALKAKHAAEVEKLNRRIERLKKSAAKHSTRTSIVEL